MTTYARLDPLTMQVRDLVVLSAEQYQALNGNPKQAYVRPLIVDVQPLPSSSQTVAVGPYVVEALRVRQTWLLISKTAEQIAEEQAVAARQADFVQIRNVLLQLKNGTGTSAERVARLEAVVFRLAKDAVG